MKRRLLLAVLLPLAGCAGAPHTAPSAGDALAAPAQADLYLGVVTGLIHQQRYEAAIAFLDQYAMSEGHNARFNKLMGDAQLGAGRYEAAATAYAGALSSPFAAEAYNGIGNSLSARCRWTDAADNFRHASQLDPANAQYLNNLAYAQLQQNYRSIGLASAVIALERAHQLDPGSVTIRDNLILAVQLSGKQTRLQTLLDAIPDRGERKAVSDFVANWKPGVKETGKTGLEMKP